MMMKQKSVFRIPDFMPYFNPVLKGFVATPYLGHDYGTKKRATALF
jgi:hypothetical protein